MDVDSCSIDTLFVGVPICAVSSWRPPLCKRAIGSEKSSRSISLLIGILKCRQRCIVHTNAHTQNEPGLPTLLNKSVTVRFSGTVTARLNTTARSWSTSGRLAYYTTGTLCVGNRLLVTRKLSVHCFVFKPCFSL